MSTRWPWTSEVNVRNWHILDQFSDIPRTYMGRQHVMPVTDVHRTSTEHQNLTSLTGPKPRHPWDVHQTSGIDVSYGPKLDQSPDIHRTSLRHQDSMSDSDLSWTKSLTSPGCLHDVGAWHQYLTYPVQWCWCPQAIAGTSVLTWPK